MSQIISKINEYTRNESNKILNEYKNNPVRLIQDNNRENEAIKGYKGREILELLQNAEDALIEDSQANIFIELTDTTLRFCNNGTPFSENGVRSLLYSNVSSKKKEESIGNKGTGFRSLLNWAHRIRIYSGDLSISFSQGYARKRIKKIKEDETVRLVIENEEEAHSKKISLATLVVPKIIPPLENKEYDTIIEVDIKSGVNGIKDEISEQLANITDTTLLFLPKVKKIEILEDGNSRIFTKRQKNKNEVFVDIEDDNTSDTKSWYMSTYSDSVIVENDEGEEEKRKYSVSVALPRNDTSVENENYLYSYFKTRIELPFNALLHGTFDLDANRNQLTNEEHNTTIFKAACKLLIDTTIECYKNDEADYAILEKLIISSNISYLIPSSDKVQAYYYKTIAEQEIFPTVNHAYIRLIDRAKFYPFDFVKYLKGDIFEKLLLRNHSEELNLFIYKIATSISISLSYNKGELEGKINSILDEFSYNDRAILCITCISCSTIDIKTINFILDSEGIPIGNKKIFFPNNNNTSISLPNGFTNVRFTDLNIYNAFLEIAKRYKMEKTELHQILEEAFDILEYDLESIIEIVIKEYVTKENNKIEYSKDIINWLFTNHLKNSLSDNIIDLCSEYLEFPTRSGGLELTENLFFASEYENSLIENLLPNKEHLFICSAKYFNIPAEEYENFVTFLERLGVSYFPRKILHIYPHTYPQDNYQKSLLKNLNFPLKAYDYTYNTLSDLQLGAIHTHSFQYYEEILSNTPTKYIIDWLRTDQELQHAIIADITSEIEVASSSQKKWRYVDTPIISYARYKLLTIPWIEHKKHKYTIEQCIFKHNIASKLEPYLIELNFEEIYGVNLNSSFERDLKKLFRDIIGVAQNFSKLKADKVYKILNTLPENRKDKLGKISKIIYKEICTKEFSQRLDIIGYFYSSEYCDFCSSGKVFCKDGVFRNIHEVNYLRKPLPKSIEKKFNLIDIEYGKDPNLIEKTLNVSLLEVDTKLISYKEHSLHKNFLKDFYEYKKLAFCYTINKKDDAQELEEIYEKIKKLKLILCSNLQVEFDGNLAELDENNFYNESDIFYLKAALFTSINDFKNIEFSSAIAEIFDKTVESGEIAKYRELYASNERKKLIALTGESLYEESRQYFDGDKEDKELFFEDCKEYNPADLEMLREYIENIDFTDINSKKNFETLKLIFKLLSINNIDEFNKNSAFDIDLTEHYEEVLYTLGEKYKKDYINLLFENFADKSEVEKGRFGEEVLHYTKRIYHANNLANYSPDNEFKIIWGEIPPTNFDLEDIWKINYNKLAKGKDKNILKAILEDDTYHSLLYFNNTEKIANEYKKREQAKIDSEAPKEEIENIISTKPLDIVSITPTAPEKEPQNPNTSSGAIRGFQNLPTETEKAQQGQNAEELVYNSLKEWEKSGEISQLEWASENGYLAGNSAGQAGLGYDISYLENSTGVKKYIEVKSTKKTSLSFIMTQNELNFAEKNAKNYTIYLITNMSKTPKTYLLEDLFVYDDGESCNKNSKFLLKEKDFEIFIEEQVSC